MITKSPILFINRNAGPFVVVARLTGVSDGDCATTLDTHGISTMPSIPIRKLLNICKNKPTTICPWVNLQGCAEVAITIAQAAAEAHRVGATHGYNCGFSGGADPGLCHFAHGDPRAKENAHYKKVGDNFIHRALI
jgi:hypothetical protein